jgi:hypothetical protein
MAGSVVIAALKNDATMDIPITGVAADGTTVVPLPAGVTPVLGPVSDAVSLGAKIVPPTAPATGFMLHINALVPLQATAMTVEVDDGTLKPMVLTVSAIVADIPPAASVGLDVAHATVGTQPVPGAVVVVPPVVMESADKTSVTTAGPVINASRTPGTASTGPFDTFALTANPGFIVVNGVTDTVTSLEVVQLFYKGHQTFQQNSALLWWMWDGTTPWVSTPTDPTI